MNQELKERSAAAQNGGDSAEQGTHFASAREISRGARRRIRVRLVRPHEHRRARGAGQEQDQVHQHAARAGRGAHGRRLRARQAHDRGGAVAPRPRPDQRIDGRRERRARLDPDGRHRRRRAEPLLRQASPPGSEPARRCFAVRDLQAVRQARVARRAARIVSGDHREGVPARRERPTRPGAGLGADGHLLDGGRHRAVRAPGEQHQEAAQAVDGRGRRRANRARRWPKRRARWSTPAAA